MLIWLILIPLLASACIGFLRTPGRATALVSAFLTLVLGHPLQSGNGDGQQLHNNGAVDIGLDAEGKHGGVCKGIAAHECLG